MKTAAALIAAFTLILGSCASTSKQDPMAFESAPLFGMIYDLDNRPCAGIDLVVDEKQKAVSDIDGRFVLLDLKRGPHRLTARAAEYEAVSLSFDFANRTQVLYLKLVSFGQLLAQAQEALDRGKWSEAGAVLARAAALHDSDTVLVYLRAILDYRQGNPVQAASRLESLAAGGSRAPYVYLFLADLYQYSLGRQEQAAQALTKYLEQGEDPDARTRLESLSRPPG